MTYIDKCINSVHSKRVILTSAGADTPFLCHSQPRPPPPPRPDICDSHFLASGNDVVRLCLPIDAVGSRPIPHAVTGLVPHVLSRVESPSLTHTASVRPAPEDGSSGLHAVPGKGTPLRERWGSDVNRTRMCVQTHTDPYFFYYRGAFASSAWVYFKTMSSFKKFLNFFFFCLFDG